MADQDDLNIKFNFDNADAIKKLLETKQLILDLGDGNNLKGLLSSVTEFTPYIAAAGAALFAFKAGFDLTLEGEEIKQINFEFETLTKNLGISATSFKASLEKSANGLSSTNDVLAATNKAMLELGINSQKSAQILEVARKTANIFGGDMLTRFEEINQAVASGSTRQLRHLGIIVDQKKAYEDYARSIGVAVDELTLQGRQHAVLNAVLDSANKNLKDTGESLKPVTIAWQQFKVTLKESKEELAALLEKYLGPVLEATLKGATKVIALYKFEWKSLFGADTTKEVETLTGKVKELHQEVAKGPIEKAGPVAGEIDTKKAQENAIKRDKELLKIHEDRNKLDQEINQSAAYSETLIEEEKVNKIREFEIKKEEVRQFYRDQNRNGSQEEKDAIMNIERTKANEIMKLEHQKSQAAIKALEQQSMYADTAAKKMSGGFQLAAKQSIQNMNHFALLGKTAFTSVKKNSIDAFKAMGDGSKNAGEAMKGFLFNSLADVAEAQGEMFIAEGIGDYDPIKFAEGGVLVALSGFMRSQAGGGSSMGGGAGSAGGGGGALPAQDNTAQGTDTTAPQMAAKKTLNVNIQGSYFETDQTRTRLMEIMRESTDITDFNLTKIGSQ